MSTPQPTTLAERIIGRPLTDPDVLDELKRIDPAAAPVGDDDDLDWCSDPGGVDVSADPETERITDIFMFAEGEEDHEQFAGALPGGIAFDWDRAKIAQRLGKPTMHGPEHDRWELEAYSIVVEYDAAGRVTSVTLTTD